MATDIAFVVGCLSLLGKRVPYGVIVMMLSLAIVDDLAAVGAAPIGFVDYLAVGSLDAERDEAIVRRHGGDLPGLLRVVESVLRILTLPSASFSTTAMSAISTPWAFCNPLRRSAAWPAVSRASKVMTKSWLIRCTPLRWTASVLRAPGAARAC